MTADRPATEPHEHHWWCQTCEMTMAEAAQGAAPLDEYDSMADYEEHMAALGDPDLEGAAPRAEGLLHEVEQAFVPVYGPGESGTRVDLAARFRAWLAAPRAEGLDSDELLSALSDILRWTKPGSLFMDGTHGYSPAGPEKVARLHNRARAAFGDAPLPPAPAAPRAEGLDVEMWDELRRVCPDCRTPDQSGTRNGYSCPPHRDLYVARLSRPSDEREASHE